MAVSTDPLQRQAVRIVSSDTGDRFATPPTNSALQLASALGEFVPAVKQAGEQLADSLRSKAEAQAQRDAIANGGTEIADATRAGHIEPTRNPWYVSAYRRESAALRTQHALRALQVESTTWAEQSDPAAFARRWQAGVKSVAEQVGSDEDSARGFSAAEVPLTNQTLASNVEQRAHSMEAEREQNVSALASQSIADAVRRSGGTLSPNAAYEALTPARTRWFATGGDVDGWNRIMTNAVVTAADSTANANLVDLARAPELINGPSEAGNTPMTFRDVGAPSHPSVAPAPAPAAQGEAPAFQPGADHTVDEAHSDHPPAPHGTVAGRAYLPVMGAVTGRFGERRARDGGGYRAHVGTDLAVPVGTHLTAPPVLGHVAFAGERGNYGNLVEVQYGNGVSIRVGHLSQISVQQGQLLPPGGLMGLSGGRRGAPGAGNATGPHVHYEVRRNGVAVDPRTVTFTNYHGQEAPQQANANAPLPADAPAIAPPSQAQAEPAISDIVSRGPSLYDIAGSAGVLEGARYRIGASIRSQAQDRLQAEVATRKLAGMSAMDQLWQRYGTRLLTGNFERNTVIQELQVAGYPPQVIAEALSQLNSAVHDGASITEAQITAHSSTPTEAEEILDIAAEGRRTGDSPEYQHRVGQLVLQGRISRVEGEQMVAAAIGRTQALEAQSRAEAAEDRRRQREANPINNYGQLDDRAQGLAEYAIAQAQRAGLRIPQGSDAAHSPIAVTKASIRRAMSTWLATHPNDWVGAEQAGRDAAARIIRSNMARRQAAISARSPAGMR